MICRNEFVDDDMDYDKSLLGCGHMHHKQCLQNYERHQWHNDIFMYGTGECPPCQQGYLAHLQKFVRK